MDDILCATSDGVPWCMLFADDIVLVAETKTELNSRLATWKSALEEKGQKINIEKTEYLCSNFSGNQNDEDVEVCIEGYVLTSKDCFKYLKSKIHKDGESECWAIKKDHVRRMEDAEMRMLRWACGRTLWDMTPNSAIRMSLGVVPVSEKLRERRLQWFGHVLRRQPSDAVRRVESITVDGARRRGRPRLKWEYCLRSDLNDLALTEDIPLIGKYEDLRPSCAIADGTNAMKRHTDCCKKVPFNLEETQTMLDFESRTKCNVDGSIETVSILKLRRFDQEKIREALAKMVIVDELPFSFVERESLGLKRILTVTVDNASSNDLVIKYLKQIVSLWDGSVLDAQFLHMRCAAHILNLVVNDGLKDVNDSATEVRATVKYVRWNSTYCMLKSALVFRKTAKNTKTKCIPYTKELRKVGGLPDDEDLEKVTIFLHFLEFMRHKLRYVEWIVCRSYDPRNSFDLCQQIKNTLTSLFDLYASSKPSALEIKSCSMKSSGQGVKGIRKLKGKKLRKDFVNEVYANNELSYSFEKARDVLAILVSTVASESAFSTEGLVLDFFRTSLTLSLLVLERPWMSTAE
ncbi:hypothetical protein F3Y22_tig00111358pilonHSYRG00037 [Hibiscus syriacus]|uniref:Reverse transcriptase domain-containing protein n=1 Tax=Hibiscus syriacus TaxID=106335 RepID=A0A6A2YNI7_HIBSY|nr:hypothetical protein F3Y22_tig00111358pilonHSYRG00037 [Hibiscus syriacus]